MANATAIGSRRGSDVFMPIDTTYRRIVTPLPVPQLADLTDKLQRHEPRAREQLPTFWERADGVQVHDSAGNTWLDWTSGILTANAGHGHPAVVQAICNQAATGVLHSYRFPIRLKAEFLDELLSLTGYDAAVLLSTGSEAVEVALRLARERGRRSQRDIVVSFTNAFHGSTAGARAASGVPTVPPGIGQRFVQCSYPADDARDRNHWDVFLEELHHCSASTDEIGAVIFESYQGTTLAAADTAFMQQLAAWCQSNDIVLIADEVQSGFGRTGRLFGFEHFGIRPDVVCCGKGISGSLPLSAVLCKDRNLMGFGSDSLNSTHSGNPISLAAGLANLRLYADGTLLTHAADVGARLQRGVRDLSTRHPDHIASAHGLGMVAGLQVIDARLPSLDKAKEIVTEAWRRGLLMFNPIAIVGTLIKLAPPLVSTAAHIDDGLDVLDQVLQSVHSGA